MAGKAALAAAPRPDSTRDEWARLRTVTSQSNEPPSSVPFSTSARPGWLQMQMHLLHLPRMMLLERCTATTTEIAYHINEEIKDKGHSPKCCSFYEWRHKLSVPQVAEFTATGPEHQLSSHRCLSCEEDSKRCFALVTASWPHKGPLCPCT